MTKVTNLDANKKTLKFDISSVDLVLLHKKETNVQGYQS